MKNAINFTRGDSQTFNNLIKKDNNTVYFITDTKQIFLGNEEYTDKIFNLPTFDECAGARLTGEIDGVPCRIPLESIMTIQDKGKYYKSSSIEDALQELGARLNGVEELLSKI